MSIYCKKEDPPRKLNTTKTSGALEINLPCNCRILYNDKLIADYLQPCDRQDAVDPIIKHLLPITWTTLDDLQMDPLETHINHEFDNITKLINENWTLTSPTYFIHNTMKQQSLVHVSLKHKLSDILNDTHLLTYILLVWITILTLILFISIYFIHILTIQLKYLRPQTAPRDYPLQPIEQNN